MIDLSNGWTDAAPFPEQGMPKQQLEERLQERLAEVPDWDQSSRLGFAMTEPHPVALQTLQQFLRRNPNNIGIHTRFGEGKLGVRKLEKEAIGILAGLYHGGAMDGYITSGGTEGNLCGLRIGRNALRNTGNRNLVVIATELTHHSNQKAAEILDLPYKTLSLTTGYTINPDELKAFILQEKENGVDGVIIVSTVGYFSAGLVDPVDRIAQMLEELQQAEPDFGIYHHVDAAYGGFVIPFTNPEFAFDFRNRKVHSMTIDPHKMGLMPYGCGAFLCRKGLLDNVAIVAGRSGVVDETIIGSRHGAYAASLWATLHALGRSGFEQILSACLEKASRFVERVREIDPNVIVLRRPDMNVFALGFSILGGQLPVTLEQEYRLVANKLPVFANGQVEQHRTFYHFYMMPSLSEELLDTFLGKLAEVAKASLAPLDSEELDFEVSDTVFEIQSSTPCPRHQVVHPLGQRDSKQYPHNYSFHKFHSRKKTREPIQSKALYQSKQLGEAVVLYAPDLEHPFENELGGIGVHGKYHFEILDSFQAELSLIGNSHLFLHSQERQAQVLGNFYANGTFRSLELKMGDLTKTDEVQLFSDQILIKIGKDSRSFYRGNHDFSFSIDTSVEIRLTVDENCTEPVVTNVQYNADPYLSRRSHLLREQLKRFPNRFFGTVLEMTIPKRVNGTWTSLSSSFGDGVFRHLVGESALRDRCLIELVMEEGMLSVVLHPIEGSEGMSMILPVSLGKSLEFQLPRLDVSAPEKLDVLEVARYSEHLYTVTAPIVDCIRNSGSFDLSEFASCYIASKEC